MTGPSPSTVDATSPIIKFFCSYGGKIIPRHPDGKLRYLGGHTRVLAVHRSIPFSELQLKLEELCGTPVTVRCQLPTEDLDALVSITCDEDLANIIEEYDRLLSPPSPLRIRVFLSPPTPCPFSSPDSKSSSSSTSSSSSCRTLSAASAAAVASSSPRCSMMLTAGDCNIRHKLLPPVSFPMGLEISKKKIAHHYPVPHPESSYQVQRHLNTPQYYLLHNRNYCQ